jgi:hypothetical protein
MLWILGLGTAAAFTAAAAKFLDARFPSRPLWQRLVLASLTLPLAWTAFNLIIFPVVALSLPDRSRVVRMLPAYLHEVILRPGLNLWICGAICAAFLGYYRHRTASGSETSQGARYLLLTFFFLSSMAVVMPIGMEVWFDTGRVGAKFALAAIDLALLVGAIPVIAVGFTFLQHSGVAGFRVIHPFAAAYATMIAGSGLLWHRAMASHAGASAVWLLMGAALFGVFGAWLIGLYALRVGEARGAEVRAELERQGRLPQR